jgi:hypothetical protein
MRIEIGLKIFSFLVFGLAALADHLGWVSHHPEQIRMFVCGLLFYIVFDAFNFLLIVTPRAGNEMQLDNWYGKSIFVGCKILTFVALVVAIAIHNETFVSDYYRHFILGSVIVAYIVVDVAAYALLIALNFNPDSL